MLRVLRIAIFAVVLLVVLCNVWIIATTAGRVYRDINQVPENDICLVLGTAKYVRKGEINQHFQNRIVAAARLYHAGKVRHLIVSGDNAERWHDEPSAMKTSLEALGVPAKAITRDYAGLRTLDSVVRAKRVFGQEKFTIVSDEFHTYRALFISDHHGIKAIAFSSENVPVKDAFRSQVREIIARVRAVLDIYLWNTRPQVEGPPVEIRIE